jgi:hypothetical protein
MLCYYADAECHVLFTIMLNVIMQIVIMLNVVAPCGVVHSGICHCKNFPPYTNI